MPEGHTVHRLARTLRDLFEGERLGVTSPQGRFAGGAGLLDGRRLVEVEAWGKQLFCAFETDPRGPGGAPQRSQDSVGRDDGGAGAEVLWLRTHLGLYGAWTFAGAPGVADVAHAIGAPRKRIGERETVLATSSPGAAVAASSAAGGAVAAGSSVTGVAGGVVAAGSSVAGGVVPPGSPTTAGPAVARRDSRGATAGNGIAVGERGPIDGRVVPGEEWEPPAPRGQVRVRLVGERAVADLTGPAACEVITTAEKHAVTARLGPDPIRDGEPGHDADRFVAKAGRSRVTIGQLLMDQAVIAGVGNIYRAEALFRAGVDPLRPGRDVPASSARAIWDDLVVLMRDGARTGAIVTTRPEHRAAEQGPGRRRTRQNTDGNPGAVAADQAFYVYHRDGLPCRVCGAPILLKDLAGRNLFWCATCQP